MTREIFGQYFSYFAVIGFSWVLVGQIIQSNLTVEKLERVSGTIDTTIEVATHRRRSNRKDHELRIFLNDTSEYFRIMDIYKYTQFQGQIHRGDTTEIFIRPKWLVPLGLGYRNDIFQMTLNSQTIFDVSKTKRNTNGIILISIIAIPLFLFVGQLNKRKRRK